MDIGGGIEVIPRNGNIPGGLGNRSGIAAGEFGEQIYRQPEKLHWAAADRCSWPGTIFEGGRKPLRWDWWRRVWISGSVSHTRIPICHGSSWSSLFSLSAERTSQNPIFTALLEQTSFSSREIVRPEAHAKAHRRI